MTELLQAESTLTQKYQTTIPYLVRQALGLEKGSKINYQIQADGSVIISRIENKEDESDPILEKFLDFLTEDMNNNPQNIQAIASSQIDKINLLVGDMSVDLDVPLQEEEE